MTEKLGYQQVLALVLEQLATQRQGQYDHLAESTIKAARLNGLLESGRGFEMGGRSPAEVRLAEHVREAMWDCLLRRLIVFGYNDANPEWPFYRVTAHGETALANAPPQPYDPDGFVGYLDQRCPGLDAVVRSYVMEAVQAFNAGCTRSAAVMLGCASEKLLLVLCDAFEAAITDTQKQAKFAKELNSRWPVSHKYSVLRKHLEFMVAAKRLPDEHRETVGGELASGFEFLRRCRNSAGHPDLPGDVQPDTVFLNLRAFTEYARRVQALLVYFAANKADW